MNKIIMILLFTAMVSSSCVKKKTLATAFSMQLHLEGFKDHTPFKLMDLDKGIVMDSSYIQNGKLSFNGTVGEPFTARIQTVDNKYLTVWIENQFIKISGNYKDFYYSHIQGSPLNQVMIKYRNEQRPLQSHRDSLINNILQLEVPQKEDTTQTITNLWNQVTHIDEQICNIRVKSIVSEAPSYYTIKELYFLRNDFDKDSLKRLFNTFPKRLQRTKYGHVINTYIENKPVEIGDPFRDIRGMSTTGKPIALSDFKGSYIVLDFWASWCGPCRMEHPNLIKTYDRFKDKNFEIFSFSIDTNMDSWKQAVVKDTLKWTTVIDTNGSYSSMAALYNVRAIPASFLINPEGIIIAKNLRGKALDDALIQELE